MCTEFLFLLIIIAIPLMTISMMAKTDRSFHDLPFSNGIIASKYNFRINAVDTFQDHIYSNINESTKSSNLIRELSFNFLLKDGQWVSSKELIVTESGYLPGTGIGKIVSMSKDNEDIKITQYYFSPFTTDKGILVVIIKKQNVAKVKPNLIRSNGEHQIKINKFDDNSDAFLIVLGMGSRETEASSVITHFVAGRDAGAILDAEKSFWTEWHDIEYIPSGLTVSEKNLYLQSTAMLKMGQCREKGSPHGQILASIPPGIWNIAWVRDGAYAISGLTRSGHYKEARLGLEFILKSECGKYVDYKPYGHNYGVGADYQVSVCRYFGNGKEESDRNDNGPNIEYDGFGLFLWCLYEYVIADKLNGRDFLNKYWIKIKEKIGDVVVNNLMDDNLPCSDKKAKLIRIDSGPWEQHVHDDGYDGAKHFSYTTICNFKGLDGLFELSKKIHREQGGIKRYETAKKKLQNGFHLYLVEPGHKVIRQSMERTIFDKYMIDAAAVEAINFGIVESNGEIAKNTINAFNEYLRVNPGGSVPRYRRNNNDHDYDCKEWVVIDLRIASALIKMGDLETAKKILDWITTQSKSNFNIISELYDEETADYAGQAPMCGFGPGAYIISMCDYYEKLPERSKNI